MPKSTARNDIRMDVAKLWKREIEHQPMTLDADGGVKCLLLAEMTMRIFEDAGWSTGQLPATRGAEQSSDVLAD